MLFLYISYEYSSWDCFAFYWFSCFVVAFVGLCRNVIASACGLSYLGFVVCCNACCLFVLSIATLVVVVGCWLPFCKLVSFVAELMVSTFTYGLCIWSL